MNMNQTQNMASCGHNNYCPCCGKPTTPYGFGYYQNPQAGTALPNAGLGNLGVSTTFTPSVFGQLHGEAK